MYMYVLAPQLAVTMLHGGTIGLVTFRGTCFRRALSAAKDLNMGEVNRVMG